MYPFIKDYRWSKFFVLVQKMVSIITYEEVICCLFS